MNVFEEIKEVVKVEIDEEALAEKLFEKAVDPLMVKLTDLIPTEFDDVFYAAQKEELKEFFKELLKKGEEKLEEATGVDL